MAVNAAAINITVPQATAPGQVLQGNANGTYTPKATSTLGFISSINLNGLTGNSFTFATGTSGTAFNISSSGSIHTFNIPYASGSITGQLQSADWLTFNDKLSGSGTANYLVKFTGASTTANSLLYDDGTYLSINSSSPTALLTVQGSSTLPTIPIFRVSSSSNSTLFTVNANGNVGIGTTEPGAKLDVAGRLWVNGVSSSLTGGMALAPFVMNTDSIGRGIRMITSDYNDTDTGTALMFGFGAGTGNTVASLTVYVDGSASYGTLSINSGAIGNVGIGMAAPLSRLAVRGNVSIGTSATYYNVAAPASGLIVEGNVGIGTTTPANLLQVVGNIQIGSVATGTAYGLIFNTGSTTNQTTVKLTSTTSLASSYILTLPTTTPAAGKVMATDVNGNLYWTDTVTGAITSISALTGPAIHVATTSDTNITLSISTTTANTLTFIPGWTGQLSIARGGTATSASPTLAGQLLGAHGSGSWGIVNLFRANNITITTSTLGRITIQDSLTPTFTTLTTGQGQYELYAMNQNVQTTNAVTFATATLTGLVIGGDTLTELAGTGLTVSGAALQTTLGTSVDLTSEITGVLPIANGGINTTTSPTLAGQLLAAHGSGSWGVVNLMAGANITITGAAGGSGNSAWTIGNGLIYNATTTDIVGIGQTTPHDYTGSDRLSVAGSIIVDATYQNTGTRGNWLQFGADTNEGIMSKRSAGGNQYGMEFWTGGVSRITILGANDLGAAGNVGIGTPAPQYNLEVNGTASATTLTLANPLGIAYGGTGSAVLTAGNILFGNNGNAIATSSLFTFSASAGLTVSATSTLATTTITKLTVTNASTTNITVSGDLAAGTIRSGTWNGSAIDIGSFTNLAAGRSLTLSGDSVEADAELFTWTKNISITAASGVITATTSAAQFGLPSIATITWVGCSTDVGGATIQLDERAYATPTSAGTDVLTAVLNCITTSASTTAFSNAGISDALTSTVNLDIDLASTTVTRLRITVKGTLDD